MVNGYGQINVLGKARTVHRVSYEMFKGEIGSFNVCHTCDVRNCVNPEHLWLGTQKENLNDMQNKGRKKTNMDHLKGTKHPLSKLSFRQVQEIRDLTKVMTHREVAKHYGVVRSTVTAINNFRTRQYE